MSDIKIQKAGSSGWRIQPLLRLVSVGKWIPDNTAILKEPVKIVHAGQFPVPFSKILEQSQIPTEERVHQEAEAMLGL